MLQFETHNKLYQMDREPVEALLQQGIHDLLAGQQMIDRATMSMLDGMISLFLMRTDLQVPKGANKLEYLAAYILKAALDLMEGQPIPVDVKEVAKHAEEAHTN